MRNERENLINLLDYVEQVVRLDERIAFQLSDYRLPDGSALDGWRHLAAVISNLRHEHEAMARWEAFARALNGPKTNEPRSQVSSPLGKVLAGSEEGDELEVDLGDGQLRKVLIETVLRPTGKEMSAI
jgi:hypothetical protein